MKKITAIIVTYEDGTTESFTGTGSMQLVNSSAAADKGSPGRDYRYVDLTLALDLAP